MNVWKALKPAPPPRMNVLPKRFNPQMIEKLEAGLKKATRRVITAGNSIVKPGSFDCLDLDTGRFKWKSHHARQVHTDGPMQTVSGEGIMRARCAMPAGPRVVTVESKIKPGTILWVRAGQRGGTRKASKLTLLVHTVRPQRLQAIVHHEALAEGVPTVRQFAFLWCSINGPRAWLENPWVWAYEFTVVRMNVDEYLDLYRTGGVLKEERIECDSATS